VDDQRSRLERFLEGDELSPLELLVGPKQYGEEIVRNAFRWAAIVLGAAALAFGLASDWVRNKPALAAALVVGASLALAIRVVGPNGRRVFFSLLAISAGAMSAVLIWAAGPALIIATCAYPAYTAAVFLFFNRRVATIATAATVAGYALVVLLADGYPRPFVDVFFLGATAFVTAITISRLVTLVEALARNERRLHVDVAEARAQLEGRVAEQVEEIDRLGKLRRFLTPQVAESVLSGDAETLLGTHRKRIAVFFCDLRGFTRFSSTAEPEDIAEMLTEYYEILGRAIDAHRATVGGFGGDGVFAFFNDPFPIEDPAGAAFTMALSLREPLRAAQRAWEARGFSLGYGLSIAYGYATMSTIGFESRSEYTAVGSVVNLGARLCDAAAPGELLIDARAYNELKPETAGVQTSLMLKGFNDPVTAYRVRLS
jgi:class 3 adenylate cyclase